MAITKTALVIGATGLIGRHLTKLLLEDPYFKKVKVYGRRSIGISHKNLEEYLVDFDNLSEIKGKIQGDVLFSTLGTTISQAGGKDAQYLVDFTYQYEFAKIAVENGISEYLLVSSSGANSMSRFFYTRMKGELDDAVSSLPFSRIRIFRPSLLLGTRSEKRTGELIGSKIMKLIKYLPYLRKYRAIKGEEVAQSMINSCKRELSEKVHFFTLDEIFHEL